MNKRNVKRKVIALLATLLVVSLIASMSLMAAGAGDSASDVGADASSKSFALQLNAADVTSALEDQGTRFTEYVLEKAPPEIQVLDENGEVTETLLDEEEAYTKTFQLDSALISVVDGMQLPYEEENSVIMKQSLLESLEGMILVKHFSPEELNDPTCQALVVANPETGDLLVSFINVSDVAASFSLQVLDENGEPLEMSDISALILNASKQTLTPEELAALQDANIEIIEITAEADAVEEDPASQPESEVASESTSGEVTDASSSSSASFVEPASEVDSSSVAQEATSIVPASESTSSESASSEGEGAPVTPAEAPVAPVGAINLFGLETPVEETGAPESATAPESTTPESTIPESTTPESVAPESTVEEPVETTTHTTEVTVVAVEAETLETPETTTTQVFTVPSGAMVLSNLSISLLGGPIMPMAGNTPPGMNKVGTLVPGTDDIYKITLTVSGDTILEESYTDVVLLFDISTSMSTVTATGNSRFVEAKNATYTLIDSLEQKAVDAADTGTIIRVALVTFGTNGSLQQQLVQLGNGTNAAALKTKVQGLNMSGTTNTSGALETARTELYSSTRAIATSTKYVVVMSDGAPNSTTAAASSATTLKNQGTTILSIGMYLSAGSSGEKSMQEIASVDTDGVTKMYFEANSPATFLAAISAIMGKLNASIADGYVVDPIGQFFNYYSYSGNNPVTAGTGNVSANPLPYDITVSSGTVTLGNGGRELKWILEANTQSATMVYYVQMTDEGKLQKANTPLDLNGPTYLYYKDSDAVENGDPYAKADFPIPQGTYVTSELKVSYVGLPDGIKPAQQDITISMNGAREYFNGPQDFTSQGYELTSIMFAGEDNSTPPTIIPSEIYNKTTTQTAMQALMASGTSSIKNDGTGYYLDISVRATYTVVYQYSLVVDLSKLNVAPASKTYGDADPASYAITGWPTGASASDFNITFTRTNTSQNVGNYPVNVGITLKSNVETNKYWIIGSPPSTSLTINPKNLTIVVADHSVPYGTSALPTLTATYTGFISGESATTIGGSLVDTKPYSSTTPQGSYPGVLQFQYNAAGTAAKNYNISVTQGNLTVTTAGVNFTGVTVKGADAQKTYGDADPAWINATNDLSAVSSHLNGVPSGIDQTQFSVTIARTAGENVGTYNMTVTITAKNTNYSISAQPANPAGTFTINKRNLTITVANESVVYGTASLPAITATYSGFATGESATTIDGVLVDTKPYTPTLAKGTYNGVLQFQYNTAKASNYNVTVTQGNLTVTAQAINFSTITVNPADATKIYGNADPAWISISTSGVTNTLDAVAAYLGNVPTGIDLSQFNVTIKRATGENVGSYAITVSITPNTANYTVSNQPVVPGNFTITKRDLTITVDNQSVVYGSASLPTLTATYTGFATGEGIATIGGKLNDTLPYTSTTAMGTYAGCLTFTYDSTKAGNYNIVSNTPGNIIVAGQGVDFSGITVKNTSSTKVYGNADPAWISDTGVTSDLNTVAAHLNGIPSGIDQAQFTVTISRVAGENVGSYNIKVVITPKNTNYAVTQQPANPAGSFTITKRDLTVTVTSQTVTYGDAALAPLTATYNGFAFSDNAATIGGTLTDAQPYTPTLAKGTYTGKLQFTYNSALAGNYNVSVTNGNIVVQAQAVNFSSITVNAADATKIYGNADPAWISTAGVTKTLDTLTAYLGNVPTGIDLSQFNVTIKRATGENVGPYAITVTITPNTANYTVSNNPTAPGNFQITKRNLTIVVDSQSVVYGTASLPTLTATYTGFATGEGITTIGGQLNDTLPYTATTPMGSYPAKLTFTYNPAMAGNYNIVSNTPGNITVAGQGVDFSGITVKGASATKVYGNGDPSWISAAGVTSDLNTVAGHLNGIPSGIDQTQFTATISRVAGENVGTYNIKVVITPKNTNYAVTKQPANPAGTFTITQRPLTIVVDNRSVTYGTATLPALTATYTGFAPGESATTIGGSLKDTKPYTSTLAEGSYTGVLQFIYNGALATNYNITNTPGNLTVTSQSVNFTGVTVKAADATKIYGNADPAWISETGVTSRLDTVASHLNGVPAGIDLTQFDVNIKRATGSNVGPYAITVTITPKNTNYTVSNQPATPGNFQITKRNLTIKVDNQNVVFGDPLPTLTAVYTGFAPGEDETTIGGSIVSDLPGAYTTSTSKGVYTGGLKFQYNTGLAGNYNITNTPGTLTVAAQGVDLSMVKPLDASKIYGDANPAWLSGGAPSAMPVSTAIAQGYLDGSTWPSALSAETAKFSVTFSRVAGENAGQYNISIRLTSNTIDYAVTKQSTNTSKFTINKRALEITVSNHSVTFSAPVPTLSYTLTNGTSFGNASITKNTETLAGIGGTLATNYTATSTVAGSPYVTTVNWGNRSQNYNITVVNGTVTVTAKGFNFNNVSVANATKIYGNADPVNTFNNWPAGVPQEHFDIVFTRVPGENVGNYTISVTVTPKAAYASSYNISGTIADGNLSITKRQLIITPTATPNPIPVGDDPPTYGVEYEGFAPGEDESVLTGVDTMIVDSHYDPDCDRAYHYPLFLQLGLVDSPNYDIVPGTGVLIAQHPDPFRYVVEYYLDSTSGRYLGYYEATVKFKGDVASIDTGRFMPAGGGYEATIVGDTRIVSRDQKIYVIYTQGTAIPVPGGTTPASSSDSSTVISSSLPDDSSSSAEPIRVDQLGGNGETPLTTWRGAWALVNLILTVLALIMGIVAVIAIFRKKTKDEEEEDEQTRTTRSKVWNVLSVVFGLVTLIVFLITQDLTLPMIIVDMWTILMAILTVVTGVFMFIALKRKNEEDEDDEEGTPQAPAY